MRITRLLIAPIMGRRAYFQRRSARMRGHAEAIGGRKAQSVRIEQDVNSKALHRVVADDKTARTVATHEEHAPNKHSIDAICAGTAQEKSE